MCHFKGDHDVIFTGRRSLLIHLPDARCGQLLISSVAQPGASAESMPSDAATDKAASNVTASEVTSADSCFWQVWGRDKSASFPQHQDEYC